jgi:membrane-bound serine protease (ClpP class)
MIKRVMRELSAVRSEGDVGLGYWIRRIFRFLALSQILASVGAAGMTTASCLMQGLPLNADLIATVFFYIYAMHVLPVNYAGLALILLSGILFFLEIKITSYGLLALAGLLSLVLGSLMLFGQNPEALRVSYRVLLPAVISVGGFFCVVTYLAARAVLKRPTTGAEGLIGERGEALSPVNPKGGQVFVHGEIWQAVSDEEIPKGASVVVEAVEGLCLKVVKSKK